MSGYLRHIVYVKWQPANPTKLHFAYTNTSPNWYSADVSGIVVQGPFTPITACQQFVYGLFDPTGQWLLNYMNGKMHICQFVDGSIPIEIGDPFGHIAWRPVSAVTPPPPPPTLSPAEAMATAFPLPMQSTPEARLSFDFQFADRVADAKRANGETVTVELCTRDMNATGVTGGNYPIVASAISQVFVTDGEGDNGGLGNFVSLIVPMSNLPSSVKERLIANVADPQIVTYISNDVGFLMIGYGHLQSITAPSASGSTYPTIPLLGQIGVSGKTGRSDITEHLDVGVFYVSGETQEGGSDPFVPSGVQGHDRFFGLYRMESFYGRIALIDPLWIWPLAGKNSAGEDISGIDYVCEEGR